MTAPVIPELCFGTAPLARMPGTYGFDVSEEQARETIRAALDCPYPFLDTSRNYGLGRAESRVGEVVRERGGLPAGAIISTKLDRNMDNNRFNASDARRSVEESFETLGVDHVQMLHLHDPEHAASIDEITASGGALDELAKMKSEGLCDQVGLAAGRVDVMMPILRNFDFDVLITHNRYTVLNRNAEPMIDFAVAKGIKVLNAAPYASGVLAKGTVECPRYVYQEASDEMLAPARALEAVCAEHGVPMGAVALQFSMRDARVASTIVGVSKPSRIATTLEWAKTEIPDAAWAAVEALAFSRDDPEATRDYSPD